VNLRFGFRNLSKMIDQNYYYPNQDNTYNSYYNNSTTNPYYQHGWSQQQYDQWKQSYQQPAVAEQPTYQAPAQPTYQAPAQPVYQAPAQPVYQAPAQPVYQAPAQPVYRAPAQPVYQTPVQQTYQAPVYQAPVYQATTQPVYQTQPVYKSSKYHHSNRTKSNRTVHSKSKTPHHYPAVIHHTTEASTHQRVQRWVNSTTTSARPVQTPIPFDKKHQSLWDMDRKRILQKRKTIRIVKLQQKKKGTA
jgi:hypothetical protein